MNFRSLVSKWVEKSPSVTAFHKYNHNQAQKFTKFSCPGFRNSGWGHLQGTIPFPASNDKFLKLPSKTGPIHKPISRGKDPWWNMVSFMVKLSSWGPDTYQIVSTTGCDVRDAPDMTSPVVTRCGTWFIHENQVQHGTSKSKICARNIWTHLDLSLFIQQVRVWVAKNYWKSGKIRQAEMEIWATHVARLAQRDKVEVVRTKDYYGGTSAHWKIPGIIFGFSKLPSGYLT